MKTPIMASVGEEAIPALAANVPFPRRLGTPNEFAEAAVFLLTNGGLARTTCRNCARTVKRRKNARSG
jgi:hypothetical protein